MKRDSLFTTIGRIDGHIWAALIVATIQPLCYYTSLGPAISSIRFKASSSQTTALNFSKSTKWSPLWKRGTEGQRQIRKLKLDYRHSESKKAFKSISMCPNITNLDIAIEDNNYSKKRGAYCEHFPFMDNATRLEMSQSDMFFNLSLSHISTLEILILYFLYNHSSSIPSLGKQGSEENYGP